MIAVFMFLIQLLLEHFLLPGPSLMLCIIMSMQALQLGVYWRCVTNALATNDDSTGGFVLNLKPGICQFLRKPYRRPS